MKSKQEIKAEGEEKEVVEEEAEEAAKELINRAKKEKAQLMQLAKHRATAELDKFKKDEEAKLAELRAKNTSDESFKAHLQRQLDSITGELNRQFDHDSAKVIGALLEGVMTVNTTVPRARKRD